MGDKFKHPSLPGEYAIKDGEWDIPAPAPDPVPIGYAVSQENVMRGLNEIFAKVNHKSNRQEGLTVNGMGLICSLAYQGIYSLYHIGYAVVSIAQEARKIAAELKRMNDRSETMDEARRQAARDPNMPRSYLHNRDDGGF